MLIKHLFTRWPLAELDIEPVDYIMLNYNMMFDEINELLEEIRGLEYLIYPISNHLSLFPKIPRDRNIILLLTTNLRKYRFLRGGWIITDPALDYATLYNLVSNKYKMLELPIQPPPNPLESISGLYTTNLIRIFYNVPVDEVIKPLYDNTKSIILGFRIKLFLKDRHHQIVYSRLYRDEIYRDRLKLICDLRDRLLRYPIKIASLYNTGDGYTFVIKIAGAGKTMYDSILTELNFKDLESYLDFKIVTIRIPDNYLNEKYLDLAYISNASLFLKTLASHNLEFDILYYNVISNEALIISKKEIPDTYRKYILKYARIINGVYKLVI